MKRGPKPKPQGNCIVCDKITTLKRDFYCSTCYSRKLRNGEIKKIEKKELPSIFSLKQKDYLIGSLLGDGCLFKDKPTHLPYFSVQRKKEDIAYSQWEAELLGDFVCKWYDGKTWDTRTEKFYDWVKLRTHRCEIFSSYYEKWYPNKIKVVPCDIELNSLILAVWFADDGYVRETGKGRLQLKLSTHGFDLSSVEFLVSLLNLRYNEYFGITMEKGIKPIIYASNAASWAFCEEINSICPPIDRKMIWKYVVKKPNTFKINNTLRKIKNGFRVEKN
ncbi:MAG: hypothetical protein WCG45_01885 [bacterium]